MPEPSNHPPPFQPRFLRKSDLDEIERIECDIYEFPWSRGNFVDSLAAGYDAWVFEHDSEPIAYAILMWSIDEVHLLNLSVRRDHQRRGWGASILQWLLVELLHRKAREIYLEVRPSNSAARRLYVSAGFEQIGVRKRYYPAPGTEREDALVLRRKLHP